MDIEPMRAEVMQSPGFNRLDRRTTAELRRTRNRTLTRMARVREEAIVTTDKEHELSRFTDAAMQHHVFLEKRRQAMADGDPLLHDELGAYTSMAKLGRLELLSELIYTYRRT